MVKIIDTQGSGKTKRLVAKAIEDGAVIVCRNPERMLEKIRAYGFSGGETISYIDFLGLAINNKKKYYVDDLEELLQLMSIGGFTLNKEVE